MKNSKGNNNVSVKRWSNRARSILIKKQAHHTNLESPPYLDTKLGKSPSLCTKLYLESSHSSSQQKSNSSSWENLYSRPQNQKMKCLHKLTETQINIIKKIQSLQSQLKQLKEQKWIKERYSQKLKIFAQVYAEENLHDMALCYSKKDQEVEDNMRYIEKADEDINHRIRTHQQQLRYLMDRQDVVTEEVMKLRDKIEVLQVQLTRLKNDKRDKQKEAKKLMNLILDYALIKENQITKLYLKCQSIVYQKLNAIEKNIRQINCRTIATHVRLRYMLKKELNIID